MERQQSSIYESENAVETCAHFSTSTASFAVFTYLPKAVVQDTFKESLTRIVGPFAWM